MISSLICKLGSLLLRISRIHLILIFSLLGRQSLHIKLISTNSMVFHAPDCLCYLQVLKNDLSSLNRQVTVVSWDQEEIFYSPEGAEVIF